MKYKKTLLLIFIVLVTAISLVFYLNNRADKDSSSTPNTPTTGSSSSSTSKGETPKGQQDTNNNVAPLIPSGNFVSNHHPNISGSPAPNKLSSSCDTSPDAVCVISFRKDGLIKNLESRKADSEGSVVWNWTLQEIGLTEGSWTITATATLNGQAKSATDSLQLVVGK